MQALTLTFEPPQTKTKLYTMAVQIDIERFILKIQVNENFRGKLPRTI